MRYFGRLQHREFTDLALVVGPYARWTENDYEDLQRYKPEVLLGYRVILMTSTEVVNGAHRGLRPEKVIVLDAYEEYGWEHWRRFNNELRAAVIMGYFPKYEIWQRNLEGLGMMRLTEHVR